jgi:hypothetical protein
VRAARPIRIRFAGAPVARLMDDDSYHAIGTSRIFTVR